MIAHKSIIAPQWPVAPGRELRLAMLGMVEGNGHPYSWSAIFNGYDSGAMASCPYPAIPAYLGKQPAATLGIAGAKVTHIWAEDADAARKVAQASLIPHVVERATDVLGEVDAVIVATDIGSEHVARCAPFVEAGLPIFVDKPLVDSQADLQVFNRWLNEGAAILSTSSTRYAKELGPLRASTYDLGLVRYITSTMCKSWERYGIHALEAIYPVLGAGFVSVRNTGGAGRDIVHLRHSGGADVSIVTIADMIGGYGVVHVYGTEGHVMADVTDVYYAFKAQLQAFVDYVRTGVRPFAAAETTELMAMLIGALVSRAEGGREVALAEIATGAE